MISIGSEAPDFTLPRDGNGTVSLSGLRPKKVVLYFYPKDDTPGCTTEACSFRDNLPKFGDLGVPVDEGAVERSIEGVAVGSAPGVSTKSVRLP